MFRKPVWAPLGKVNTHYTPSAGPADTRGGPGGKKKTEWQSDAKAQKPRGHGFYGLEGTLHLTPAGPGAP